VLRIVETMATQGAVQAASGEAAWLARLRASQEGGGALQAGTRRPSLREDMESRLGQGQGTKTLWRQIRAALGEDSFPRTAERAQLASQGWDLQRNAMQVSSSVPRQMQQENKEGVDFDDFPMTTTDDDDEMVESLPMQHSLMVNEFSWDGTEIVTPRVKRRISTEPGAYDILSSSFSSSSQSPTFGWNHVVQSAAHSTSPQLSNQSKKQKRDSFI